MAPGHVGSADGGTLMIRLGMNCQLMGGLVGLVVSISSSLLGSSAAGGATLPRTGMVAAIPPGTVRTIAGGIGGPARATSVGFRPCGVAFGAGFLYVSDGTAIRRVNPVSDWLTHVAGRGAARVTP